MHDDTTTDSVPACVPADPVASSVPGATVAAVPAPAPEHQPAPPPRVVAIGAVVTDADRAAERWQRRAVQARRPPVNAPPIAPATRRRLEAEAARAARSTPEAVAAIAARKAANAELARERADRRDLAAASRVDSPARQRARAAKRHIADEAALRSRRSGAPSPR